MRDRRVNTLLFAKRVVDVHAVLDKCQGTEKCCEADFLVNVGIPWR
jgi:hypothetical protein